MDDIEKLKQINSNMKKIKTELKSCENLVNNIDKHLKKMINKTKI